MLIAQQIRFRRSLSLHVRGTVVLTIPKLFKCAIMKISMYHLFILSTTLLWLCVFVSGKAVIPPGVKKEVPEEVLEKVPEEDVLVKVVEKADPNAVQMEQGGGGKEPKNKVEDLSEERQEEEEEGHEEKEEKKEDGEGEDEDSSDYESYDDNKDKKLKFEAEPPHHWDGVRLDKNGNINGDIEQELFLGPDHDDFESIPEEVGKQKLMEIFKKVDKDGDSRLTISELIDWITLKTKEHFLEAVESSKAVFPKVDTNSDGKVTWDEYMLQFLKQRGYNKNKIEKFKQGKQVLHDHDEEDGGIYKDRFDTADENEDEALDRDEFVSFMHPEHSERMLDIVVEEVLHELDQNGDKKLSLTEFVSVPLSREKDLLKMEKEDEWIRGRREEFESRIDMDKDGIASMDEIKKYMDPRNKQHAESEARHLMGVADNNNDMWLSPQEVLDNYYAFIGSKVYNYARNIHDEF